MKTLTANEVQTVSGAASWDGCHFISPRDIIPDSGLVGGAFGGATSAGAATGATWGAALGAAGWAGYNIGVGFNHAFGRCN